MGMFDEIEVEFVCPNCGLFHTSCQTNALTNSMRTFKTGSYIYKAIDGLELYDANIICYKRCVCGDKEKFQCNECGKSYNKKTDRMIYVKVEVRNGRIKQGTVMK